MGCFSSHSVNRNIKLQQGKKANTQTMQNLSQNQLDLHIAQLVTEVKTVILNPNIQKQEKSHLIQEKLLPNAEMKCGEIGKYFKNLLREKDSSINKEQQIRECIVTSSYLVTETEHFKSFSILDKNELNQLGNHMKNENNVQVLDCYIKFVENMFLEHGFTIYTYAQVLFQAMLKRFVDFSTDQKRQLASQAIIQMLFENKKLLQYVQQPYYFLEFWLYSINIQEQLDRQLYWIECVKKLYAKDMAAEDCLFYDNDFKVLIDLLIRVMGSCPDGKSLRVPLQCYLVLTGSKKMQPTPIRLNDVQEFIASINGESLGLADIFNQINSLV